MKAFDPSHFYASPPHKPENALSRNGTTWGDPSISRTRTCDAGSVGPEMIGNKTIVVQQKIARRPQGDRLSTDGCAKIKSKTRVSRESPQPQWDQLGRPLDQPYRTVANASIGETPDLSLMPVNPNHVSHSLPESFEVNGNFRMVTDIFNSCASVTVQLFRAFTIVDIFFTIPRPFSSDFQPS